MKYREYTVTAVNQGIKIVKGNQEKTVKVIDTAEFRYKLMKTKIQAAGGPDALVDWMERNIDLFECSARKIIEYAWNEMKGVR